MPGDKTGISFENTLTEDEDFNIIEYLYFFNGGGVAAGDINNDGLTDLYFSANQLPNRLYLNKGNFKFEDITGKAGVAADGNWKTGVTMVDINGDGLLDIYVCGVGGYKKFDTVNKLFVNNGDLTFTEQAALYGLDFKGLSTQASFFDYDLDGDLDMYLLNHSVHSVRSYGNASSRLESDSVAGDRLYRNEADKGSKRFVDVTKEAGIFNSHIGYGLGISTSDINMDGLPDIYVSNDFRENDYLYLNSGKGTFKQVIESTVSHTSRFSMGNDIADFNNDALPDILTVDMMPDEEKVIKASVGEDSYEIYKYKLNAGYYYQVARNALQLNMGNGHFSDIAWLSGVAATDWSWAPLMADFDNDGLKDIFISNGIVRRPNDLNYLNFISTDSAQALSDVALARMMPAGKAVNHIFKNGGAFTFADKTTDWGMNLPSCSNGAAYADLDNDGDLDLVVNNIDQQAFVYKNSLNDSTRHFLQLRLKGKSPNTFAIGSKVFAFSKGRKIYQELSPSRGYESSVQPILTLGLGDIKSIDSLWVIWPDNRWQVLKNMKVDTSLELVYAPQLPLFDYSIMNTGRPLLARADLNMKPAFMHHENDYVDFNSEGLMPHMLSKEGPRLSVGDVNGDGLDDYFIGGAEGQPGYLYLQQSSGAFFASNELLFEKDKMNEDTGSAFFDADGDKDLDLLVVSGGNEELVSDRMMPRLYLNDGKGYFHKGSNVLPSIYCNASCVRPADIDGDGDQDIFIGARSIPGQYGINPSSYVLMNDGRGSFTDNSNEVLGASKDIGMVTDAAWADFNGDSRIDLLLVGEWMTPTVLIQNKSSFENQSEALGLKKMEGWWSAVIVADFDKDGDLDFMGGNLGLNARLKASETEPITMYVGDFDNNGSTEQILTYYNRGMSYPLFSRDQLVKQIPPLRKKFLYYGNYINATIDDLLTKDQQDLSARKITYRFQSTYFENKNGTFVANELPIEAQFFPIMSLSATDIDDDGNLDVMAAGNRNAVQPDLGRYDAGYGLVMLGNGHGGFKPLQPAFSGFTVYGEARDIQVLKARENHKTYLVSRNNDSVIAFIPDPKHKP